MMLELTYDTVVWLTVCPLPKKQQLNFWPKQEIGEKIANRPLFPTTTTRKSTTKSILRPGKNLQPFTAPTNRFFKLNLLMQCKIPIQFLIVCSILVDLEGLFCKLGP